MNSTEWKVFKYGVSSGPYFSGPMCKNLPLTYAVWPGSIKNERTFVNLAANVLDISFWSTLSSEIFLQLEINSLSFHISKSVF